MFAALYPFNLMEPHMSRHISMSSFALVVALAGCNQNVAPAPVAAAAPSPAAPAAGTVAVIDVDAISERLGLSKELQVRMQGLQQHLEAFKRTKQEQMIELQKKLGEKPTEEQIKEFRKADAEAGGEIQRAQANAQQQFNEYKNYVVNVLELSLKEPVDKVMKQRGLTVILHARQGVYQRADSADITQEVLDILSKTPDAIKLPTMPTAQPTGEAPLKNTGLTPDLSPKGADDKAPPKDAK